MMHFFLPLVKIKPDQIYTYINTGYARGTVAIHTIQNLFSSLFHSCITVCLRYKIMQCPYYRPNSLGLHSERSMQLCKLK